MLVIAIHISVMIYFDSHASSLVLPDKDKDDDSENDDVLSAYYRQNCNSSGRILYTVSCYNCGWYVYSCTYMYKYILYM